MSFQARCKELLHRFRSEVERHLFREMYTRYDAWLNAVQALFTLWDVEIEDMQTRWQRGQDQV